MEDKENPSSENGSLVPTEGGLNKKMANLKVEESKHDNFATEVSESIPDVGAAATEVGSEIDHERLGAEMQERCQILVAELEEYQEYLKKLRKENAVELRTFRSGLNAEMKLINKLASKDSSNLKIAHSIRSSNLLFYASVWSTAKTCRGITALSRRFYWEPHAKTATINGCNLPGTKQKAQSAVADIVCEDGLEWVKVSSHTEKRIIWDFAKAGWVADSDSEDDFEDDDGGDAEGLLKQVETLVKAAKSTRVRYRNPKVRLVLPRISNDPKAKEVSVVLQRLKNLGVVVQTKEDLGGEELSLMGVVERLVPDRFEEFSEVLNIDCTVMLAFVSDISHDTVEEADWHNKMIQSQRKLEAEEHLLPCVLWPACGSKKLVCTREAANRMLEIINTIGTESEKARTSLLLNTPNPPCHTFSPLTQSQTTTAFEKLSQYPIPSTWQIPLEIVSVNIPAMLADLPASAKVVAERLSDMNRSVLIYGWWSGRTTITSNRAVVRDVEGPIEEFREGEERGPEVWSCSKPRSLVGKEKERRGKEGLRG